MYYADKLKTIIIKWLLEGNMNFKKSEHAIGNEVQFGPTMRRADLLLISDELHAIEVKSDNDNLERLLDQIKDYTQTFDRTSVAVTSKYADTVKKMLPSSVGILVIEGERIREERKAKSIKRLNKSFLSTFLSKTLLVRFSDPTYRQLDTFTLRNIFCAKKSVSIIRGLVINELNLRYRQLFHYFLLDTKNDITTDDILLLNLSMPTGKAFSTGKRCLVPSADVGFVL